MIADRHAMGVAPEVAQDGGRATEGRLSVDDPVGLEERVDEGPPRGGVAQVLAAARRDRVRSGCTPVVTPRQTSRERLD